MRRFLQGRATQGRPGYPAGVPKLYVHGYVQRTISARAPTQWLFDVAAGTAGGDFSLPIFASTALWPFRACRSFVQFC